MDVDGAVLAGGVLVAGLALFLVGASAWRLEYQQALPDALPAIHRDSRRWVWIHVWMFVGLVTTPVGLAVLTAAAVSPELTAAAAAAYGVGAVCMIVALAFRLTVTTWAAERTVATGQVPDGFAALQGWSGVLYVVHMCTAYVASAVLGVAVLDSSTLPTWLGWAGVVWGLVFAAGFVLTRFAGPFNPPFWAHLYTGAVGVALLLA